MSDDNEFVLGDAEAVADAVSMAGVMGKYGLDLRQRDPYTEMFMNAQDALITQDPRMLKLKQDLATIGDMVVSPQVRSMTCSIIYGESGTGKELCAKILHGKRRGQFVPVNCSAIPSELFEAELFGSRKGSYTGAHVDRPGYFVQAQDGTIFLDEIGDLPPMQQVKLLRAIQSREVSPLGSHGLATKINCQIVAATNIDMPQALKYGKFRKDLYWRISTLEFHTVPLRDREGDVPLIINDFRRRNGIDTMDTELPLPAVYADGNIRALQAWIIRKELGVI